MRNENRKKRLFSFQDIFYMKRKKFFNVMKHYIFLGKISFQYNNVRYLL